MCIKTDILKLSLFHDFFIKSVPANCGLGAYSLRSFVNHVFIPIVSIVM
jgi:hypothetical protein